MDVIKVSIFAVVVLLCHVTIAHAQNITDDDTRDFEMAPDDLILVNVAAKARVVELLADEMARTEIVRALLVEYAQECVKNVSALERSCLDCMMERCDNRRHECNIKGPPLSEVINHSPSPILGLQFLSNGGRAVEEGMKKFTSKARTDILKDVPEALKQKGEAFILTEVDQSLNDLDDNINTERALQRIGLHVQKAADNVHELPKLGDKVSSIIVNNEDQAVNLAQVLANRLKESRPLLDSIGHNGARIMEKMPDVISEVGDKIVDFKAKVAGVFNRVVGTFQRVMDSPDTPVTNGNLMSPHINPSMMPQMSLFQQQQLMQNPNFPQGQGQFQVPLGQGQLQMSPQGQGQFQTANDQRQVMLAQLQQARQREQQLRAQFMQQQQQQQMTQNQMPSGAMVVQGQSPQVNIQPNFQQPMGVPLQGQPFGQSPEANAQMAFVQNQMQPQIKVQDNNIQQTQGFQHSHQNPGQIMLDITMPQMPAVGPIQMQASSGLRQKRKAAFSGFRGKRQADPDCKRLKDDPDTYCRTFESQCHNCTLEKRLRFQVCGEGVERARDEIKRIDQSVTSYLETYETQIASEKLVLKIEFKGLSKLKKTTSYFDPFITAKIGPSIFRYKSKRILNINDLRATGSQIGDELWEKMWENGVFAEAKEVHIVPDKVSILGQAQVKEVHSSHAHAQTHGSGGNRVTTSLMTVVFGTMIFLL